METDEQKPLYQRAQTVLASKGISGRQFAKLVGISQPYMCLFLHDHRVSVQTAGRIEAALSTLVES
jgi:hypothetical protein